MSFWRPEHLSRAFWETEGSSHDENNGGKEDIARIRDHVRGSASTSPGQGVGYGTENTADSSSPFKENHERKLPSHSINLIIVRGYKTLLTAGHFP